MSFEMQIPIRGNNRCLIEEAVVRSGGSVTSEPYPADVGNGPEPVLDVTFPTKSAAHEGTMSICERCADYDYEEEFMDLIGRPEEY